MVNEQQKSADGYELNFATNVLGMFYLTTLLIPAMHSATDPRVVTVSSGGALNAKLDLENLQSEKGFDATMAYAHQKRQQIELTEFWALKYPKIWFVSMHPGWADTPGVQSSMPTFASVMRWGLRSAEEGADSVVWLAASHESREIQSGEFVFDRKVSSKHLHLGGTQSSKEDVERLVAVCENITK